MGALELGSFLAASMVSTLQKGIPMNLTRGHIIMWKPTTWIKDFYKNEVWDGMRCQDFQIALLQLLSCNLWTTPTVNTLFSTLEITQNQPRGKHRAIHRWYISSESILNVPQYRLKFISTIALYSSSGTWPFGPQLMSQWWILCIISLQPERLVIKSQAAFTTTNGNSPELFHLSLA